MRRPSLIRQIVLGILLGTILLSPTPVQAQWTVYDPANYWAKVAEMVNEANRWVTTFNNYIAMYEKAAAQVTSLGGILDNVDETLSRNKKLITTFSHIGNSVRGVFRLKRQLENLVHCRIQAIQSIYSRLKNGLFDMEANRRDLDNYLRNVIGRRADDAIANIERLANQDLVLERLRYELNEVEVKLAEQQESLKQYEKMLEWWNDKPDDQRFGMEVVVTQIEICKQTIATLYMNRSELMAEIEKRIKRYGVVLEERGNFGQQVRDSNEAIRSLTAGKEEILNAIDEEFMSDSIMPDEDSLD